MNKKEKQGMVRTGTRDDYEVYTIMPSSVINSGNQAEVTTHYQKDTDSIYSTEDDVSTRDVSVNGKKYTYVTYGDNDLAPYTNQKMIEDNMVMSQCQNFNILTCYGQGLRFLDRDTNEMTKDKDIREFCLRNAIHRLWLRMTTDMKYHFFSVLVINLSRDHKKIVQVRARHACDCRFTVRNKNGAIEYVLVGNFRESKLTEVEPIPLLDEIDPLGDLLYRMGKGPSIYDSSTRKTPEDGKECKFAILCLMPTPGYKYYPIPYYTSIYHDAWYDIYRLIGIGKRYMIKNTSAPRIQVEVHRTYWDNVCKEEGITDPEKRKARIKQERQNITDFCTKPENAGKTWVTSYDISPDGKEKRMVRVYNLIEGKNKEGGDWSDDMQEASNSLCFAMGVHPNMVGAVPGKSQMNNSGSDKRELFTLKQSIEKAFHDIMEVPFHVISHYNNWSEKYAIDVPMIQLTTIDKNKDAEETTAKDNNNGTNQSDNK
jgi:hypothetical protein